MGLIRESFVIFRNWAEAIEALPEKYQLQTFKALVEYGFNGEIPKNLPPIVNAMLISFSAGMENSILRYNASVENGKKGGRPRKNVEEKTQENLDEPNHNLEKPSETQPNLDEPNHNLNVNVNDNVNVNERDNACARTREEISLAFPDIVIDCEVPEGFDCDKVATAICESDFLKQVTSLSWLVNHYDKVVSGYYKNLKKDKPQELKGHVYSKADFKGMVQSIDEIEL